ncbi:thioredoxin family protein [Ascidiimonas aurantiaca]|uniref:thioredoxin family protein n=1 Tax=Ascidiimonas aurantiaca TaxID=1685432 RepID=UPI0030ED0232
MQRFTKYVFLFWIVLLPLVCTSQEWVDNYDTAIALAKEKEQPIVMVFSGSDWCGPCILMDKKIWQTETFKEYASDNLIMLKVDFPKKKANQLSKELQEQNNKLARKYNRKGYIPLVVVLNAKGKVLGTTGFERKMSPETLIELLKSFES